MYDSQLERRPGRRNGRGLAAIAVIAVLALLAAACGGSRDDSNTSATTTGGTGGGGGGGNKPVVDTANCPAGNDTVGVNGDTITIGTSLPQSGTYAAFTAILNGEKAYFDYLNAQGGVEVAGKKYKINLVDKDDAYDAARTVANINSLINDTKVFALFNVVGTKNNLGARDVINSDCVPNLLIASGAVQWGNREFPWMLGSELVPYPLEMQAFVNYLKQNKPNATIAVLKANDDFGQSYAETLQTIIKGTNLKIVQTQSYDPEGAEVASQVTSLAATKADAFVLGGTLLACPSALNAMGDAGWKPIVYMSGTCVSKVLLGLAGKNANGVLSVTPLIDPSDPANDAKPAVKTYKEQVKKYAPKDTDVTDGIVAYGWTTGALFAKILEESPKLTRSSVMETARTLSDVKDVGLQLPDSTWSTGADDWFLGETFQLIKYDATAGHSVNVGPLIDDNGKTAELSPQVLLTQ
jgi:branched-chain amino acid transport system substrate-binding protein